jgi:hypothetical protein
MQDLKTGPFKRQTGKFKARLTWVPDWAGSLYEACQKSLQYQKNKLA